MRDQGSGPTLNHECPAGINPVFRIEKGWVAASLITADVYGFNVTYNYLNPNYYKVNIAGTSEYFILENRLRDGFDKYTPMDPAYASPYPDDPNGNQGGLLIWHAYGSPSYGDVRLKRADADEAATDAGWVRDPFPMIQNQNFTDITTPNTNRWNGAFSHVGFNNISWDDANKLTKVDIHPNYWTGSITQNTTWSGSVYVSGDIVVQSGVTLTIQAGTRITFAANSDDQDRTGEFSTTKCELVVKAGATLSAVGTSASRITFTASSPTSQAWYGIVFDGGTGTVSYADISWATNGIYSRNTTTHPTITYNYIPNCYYGLRFYNFSPQTVDNNTITYCTTNGIDISSSSPKITNTKVNHCGTGIYVSGGSPKFYYNTITSNSNRGAFIIGGASPQFGWLGSYGRNVIAQNGSDGVGSRYYCNVFLGQEDCLQNGGANSIYYNGSYELYVSFGSTALAEKNWWGSDPPNPSEFCCGSAYDYIPWWPGSDPNPGRLEPAPPLAFGEAMSVLRPSPEETGFDLSFSPSFRKADYAVTFSYTGLPLRDQLWLAYHLVQLARYDSAFAIGERLIAEHPDSLEAIAALNVLHWGYQEAQRPGFGDYLGQLLLSVLGKRSVEWRFST